MPEDLHMHLPYGLSISFAAITGKRRIAVYVLISS
jgi:hypothetical protein